MKQSKIRAQVVLDKAEYESLKCEADRHGLSFSAYVRTLLRSSRFPEPITHTVYDDDESKQEAR